MNNQDPLAFIERIKTRFSPPTYEDEKTATSNGKVAASVLVPFAVHDGELVLLFTHRSNSINRHRGQVSFPGGMEETGDRTFIDTALRETQEEIGLQPRQVEVFGRLPSLESTSGYWIHPFVGFIHDLNGLQKNMEEVEKIFCIPIAWIMNEGNLSQEDYLGSNGILHKVWVFKDYQDEKVWGITAEITRRLIETIK